MHDSHGGVSKVISEARKLNLSLGSKGVDATLLMLVAGSMRVLRIFGSLKHMVGLGAPTVGRVGSAANPQGNSKDPNTELGQKVAYLVACIEAGRGWTVWSCGNLREPSAKVPAVPQTRSAVGESVVLWAFSQGPHAISESRAESMKFASSFRPLILHSC